MRIAVIGEAAVDRYLQQQCLYVGGIGLNFAVYAKRSGAEQVSMISCVGDEGLGDWVLTTLATAGIDTSHVAILPGKTTTCDIVVTAAAERIFPPGGYQSNVLDQLEISTAAHAFIGTHDIAVTQWQGTDSDELLAQFLQLPRRVKRVVDFGDWTAGRRQHVPAPLDALDLAFFSGDQATVDLLQPLARQTSCLIVVTLGAGGSVALTSPQPQVQPALAVEQVVDSTGCGDAFQAAFTVNYFQDGNVATALAQGAQQAAQVLQHLGAFRQEPRTMGVISLA
jgi:fructoselysine 6-kinase